MEISESDPMLYIPTDPKELAQLLDIYATDWVATLDFFCGLAKSRGIIIIREEVNTEIGKLMGEVE